MKFKVSGMVTDFKGNPLDKSEVKILGKSSFDPVYETVTDINGKYVFDVDEGQYMALVSFYEYGTRYLENWNWNFQISQDAEVNMRIGEIEVYSINAFVPQGSPPPKVMIYFRPCSLKKYIQSKNDIENSIVDYTCFGNNLDNCDVTITVNDENVAVTKYDRILEVCGDKNVLCYILQIPMPANLCTDKVCRVKITIHDNETDEDGEGVLYANFIS